MTAPRIVVSYASIDGYHLTRRYRTLAGAARFAVMWIGADADIGASYAVSADGIGRITVEGTTLESLFERRR